MNTYKKNQEKYKSSKPSRRINYPHRRYSRSKRRRRSMDGRNDHRIHGQRRTSIRSQTLFLQQHCCHFKTIRNTW